MLAGCALRGLPLRFGWRAHALLALQGAFLYGVSYLSVYDAEQSLPSGLVAVGYSASPLVTGLGACVLFGAPLGTRFVAGGLLGLAGVALIFWPEFGKAELGSGTAVGARSPSPRCCCRRSAAWPPAATAAAACRSGRRSASAWCTAPRSAARSRCCAARASSWPAAFSWWASLAYLALAGSVLTFACFLTLQDRIGPGPTGTVGVMTPLLALVVSLLLEGYRPDALTAVGAALAVAGNALMLRRRAPRLVPAGAAD